MNKSSVQSNQGNKTFSQENVQKNGQIEIDANGLGQKLRQINLLVINEEEQYEITLDHFLEN